MITIDFSPAAMTLHNFGTCIWNYCSQNLWLLDRTLFQTQYGLYRNKYIIIKKEIKIKIKILCKNLNFIQIFFPFRNEFGLPREAIFKISVARYHNTIQQTVTTDPHYFIEWMNTIFHKHLRSTTIFGIIKQSSKAIVVRHSQFFKHTLRTITP